MRLTLLTYNIRGELWTEDATEALARIIKKHDVDLVCLQEVMRKYNIEREDGSGKRVVSSGDMLKKLRELLGKEYDYSRYLPVQSTQKSVGNAILYNKKVLDPKGHKFAKTFPKISQRSLLEEWGNRFMLPIRRVVMSKKFGLGGGRDVPDSGNLIVYNVHLDYFGGDSRRIYQINHFFELWRLDRHADGVVEIIAGDFNTWSPGFLRKVYETISILRRWLITKEFKEVTGDIRWTQIFDKEEADKASKKGIRHISIFESLLTRYDDKFKQKLDHIWVRGDVEVVSCERLDLPYSDHYPILAKLKCNEDEDDKG